ncbi:MAG: SH3 domain-containing protein [Chloroflexota bacterium]|nr:SH3 domain-containing protein [Anaerolineales bacterium]MCB8967531.1 SH3 domain-containing protein [Ardenticatenaceae bacterium]
MTAVLNIAIPALAILCVILALVFVIQALGLRGRVGRQAYGVGQVEMRRKVQIGFLRAIATFIVGALLLGIWGFMLTFVDMEPTVMATPLPTATIEALPEVVPTETAVAIPSTPSPSSPSASPTQEPTFTRPAATEPPLPTPTMTTTPSPPTVTVSSGVGVYLRAEPNTDGEQIEWVLDGTVLILLSGRVQGDEFEWQEVRSPTGNEGWVAVPFIQYNQ